MSGACVIGLDFGTESARGILLDADTGEQLAHHAHPYRHGVIARRLGPDRALPLGYALQDPADYVEALSDILSTIGHGRTILSIGVDFTASSPMPVQADGTPLSRLHPADPHAYVKLWKHAAAQPYADALNRQGGAYLAHCGGRLSCEWMLAKAQQIAAEAPALWDLTDRFLEAGDWLVWQLCGREMRSQDFASYKAHWTEADGYPAGVVAGLADRLGPPQPVGTAAGSLTAGWRRRTGIEGPAVVAVAVIDSHVVLPAVGGTGSGTLVGALGTSAVFLLLQEAASALPGGIEAMAQGAALPALWCFEAGQAGFGDMLSWFVRAFPRAEQPAANFRLHNEAAAALRPAENHLVTLDWWNGNRVPYGDSALSGVFAGLTMETTSAGMYRSLLESVCYGTRSIVDHMSAGGLSIERVILTSGLAHNNPLLVQIMADVLGRTMEVPAIKNPTAVGAAIHGAVAGRVVRDFAHGGERLARSTTERHEPHPAHRDAYDRLYAIYRDVGASRRLRDGLHGIRQVAQQRLDNPVEQSRTTPGGNQ